MFRTASQNRAGVKVKARFLQVFRRRAERVRRFTGSQIVGLSKTIQQRRRIRDALIAMDAGVPTNST
jgi:hypothetical protein